MIQLKLNPSAKNNSVLHPKPDAVASAFRDDSEDEIEEMPAECMLKSVTFFKAFNYSVLGKMRMRNIGKLTPTSAGPNSFGKTKLGFVDNKKIFEKKMNQMLQEMGDGNFDTM